MQSSSQITTNKPTSSFFTGQMMPFLSPTNSVKALKGKTKSLLNVVEKSLPHLLKVVQQQLVGEVGTFMFLVCQVVSRRLDYCNAVLAGLPAIQLSRLPSILRIPLLGWSTALIHVITWHRCCSSSTGCLFQNACSLNSIFQSKSVYDQHHVNFNVLNWTELNRLAWAVLL